MDNRITYRTRKIDAVSFELVCIAGGLLVANVLLPAVFLALRWFGVL